MIAGALRSQIHDHGPITPEWIGSAAKRVRCQLPNARARAPSASAKLATPDSSVEPGSQCRPPRRNLANFSVAVMEGDRVIHEARVVVGKPETPTPIFSDVMRYVLINPSWRVPNSIIKKEMMAKLGALSRRGYEVKTVGGRVTVRQLPGDDNALGRSSEAAEQPMQSTCTTRRPRSLFASTTARLQPRLHACSGTDGVRRRRSSPIKRTGWNAAKLESCDRRPRACRVSLPRSPFTSPTSPPGSTRREIFRPATTSTATTRKSRRRFARGKSRLTAQVEPGPHAEQIAFCLNCDAKASQCEQGAPGDVAPGRSRRGRRERGRQKRKA